MVKVKKSLSLIMAVFLILSNLAFAQSTEAGFNERKTIDNSKEGQIVVYPAQISSEKKRTMELLIKSGVRGEEMRKIIKEKFGNDFDEMEFEKGMIELKGRMTRKDAFSYEHEGYGQIYYSSPSYEGYSKEQMVFGMVFEHIGDDIDPRDIKQYCSDPEKIADLIISKFKEKVGSLQHACSRFEEQEAKCADYSKTGCSQTGTAFVREDATEMEKIQAIAYSCPANRDSIIEACKGRVRSQYEQRIKNAAETCQGRFDFEGERLLRECEKFRSYQICDKEKYMKHCMGEIKKEDFEERKKICQSYPVPSCGEGTVRQTKKDENGCGYYYCTQATKCEKPACEGAYPTGKVDENGCQIYTCPTTACTSPKCEGASKTGSYDNNGCPVYACPPTAVCTKPVCEGVIIDTGKIDSNGCVVYACSAPTTTTTKPAKITMEGGDGTWCYDSDGNGGYFSKGYCQDNSGTYNDFCDGDATRDYYCTGTWDGSKWSRVKCEHGGYVCSSGGYKCSDGACIKTQTTCPSVQKPTCNTNETIQAYYDNAGCVTSYQCIKTQTICPGVAKPTCSEGQSLTTKYDDKGCVAGYECVSISSTNTSAASITGQTVLNTYEDFLRNCENNWMEQQKICSNTPFICDKDTYIEKCKEQERKSYDDFKPNIEHYCEKDTISEVSAAEQRCSRMDEDRQRCIDESSKRCAQMKGTAQQCKELLTEETLRKFIVEEAKKRCKFSGIMQNEDEVKKAEKVEIILAVLNTATKDDIAKLELFVDNLKEELKLQDTNVYKGTIEPNRFGDVKLLPFVVNAKLSAIASSERAKEVKAKIVAGQNAEEAAGKLASLRDSDVPNEYLYIIEDKASDLLNVSDNLKELEKKDEGKGIGYKIRLFLGLAKAAEQQEVKQLAESNDKLQKSIDALTKLVDEVPSDVAKAVLKEQVDNLKNQQQEIESLIKIKEKKAKGLFGIFG